MNRLVIALLAIPLFGLVMVFITPAIGLQIEGSQTSIAIYNTIHQLFGIGLYLILIGSTAQRRD